MNITFTGHRIEVTPALKEATIKKLQRLDRFKLSQARVTFHLENVTHIAEAHIHWQGGDLHASAHASDMYAAIDDLIDKLFTQLAKQKDKMTDHH